MYKRSVDRILRVEEGKKWEEKKTKFSRGSGIMIKEDIGMVLNIGRERFDEYLESTDDWRLCKDDILRFTKRIRKRNFLDIFFKNYLPRIYRTVERLNVRYLSSEEINMRGNDQESEVYKEERILRKMEEDKEKIRIKVNIRKNKSIRGGVREEERDKEVIIGREMWEKELSKGGRVDEIREEGRGMEGNVEEERWGEKWVVKVKGGVGNNSE